MRASVAGFLMALLWSLPGAVTASGATVAVHTSTGHSVVAEHDTDPAFGSATAESAVNAESGNGFTAKVQISGLTADTQHYYRIKLDGGSAESATGAFRTAPTAGNAKTFLFAFSGDAVTGSNDFAFGEIADHEPDLFIHCGDLHYSDISTDDVSLYRAAYENSVGTTEQNALYRGRAFVYTWDDHDYARNNSGANATGRPAALKTYREQVPHYTAPSGSPDAWDAPIYQSFTWGRVRFLVLDMRSERVYNTDLLGSAQRTWMKGEITAAAATDEIVCVISPVPWVSDGGGEAWGSFPDAEEIANHIQSEDMQRRMFFISTDWHILAYDDGSHGLWATDPEPPGPVSFHASPLDHFSSFGNDEWSGGYHKPSVPQEGQYATVEITDAGGSSIDVTYTGYYVDGGTSEVWKTITYTLYTEEPPPIEDPPPPEEPEDMSIIIADRVKETTTTTGTGTVDLDGPVEGFQSFVSGVGDGDEAYYCIVGGSDWEVGIGTVTDAATDTLSRDTVLASSNSGSLVNFAAGTKEVFSTVPASWVTAKQFGVLYVRDQKTAATAGGSASATTWHTRVLNTVVVNQIAGSSLSSNQITLPAGTYRVRARAPMYRVDRHKTRLRNTTDGETTLVGSSCMTAEASGVGFVMTDSNINGRFTISDTKVFELQHYAQSAQSTSGLGLETNAAEVEIYAEVWIEQEPPQ